MAWHRCSRRNAGWDWVMKSFRFNLCLFRKTRLSKNLVNLPMVDCLLTRHHYRDIFFYTRVHLFTMGNENREQIKCDLVQFCGSFDTETIHTSTHGHMNDSNINVRCTTHLPYSIPGLDKFLPRCNANGNFAKSVSHVFLIYTKATPLACD